MKETFGKTVGILLGILVVIIGGYALLFGIICFIDDVLKI